MDKLLYGKDPEENIVCIEPLERQNVVQIFKRENGELTSRYEPFEYIIYTTKNEPLLDRVNVKTQPLLGGNHYDTLVKTKDWDTFKEFKYNAQDCKIPFEKSQYMLQTGKTTFNGMDFNSPLILYFDIETYTSDGYEFTNPSRQGDKVLLIAVRTNRDYETVLRLDEHDNESDLLQHFVHLIRMIDPDILVNHNIFNFDLSFLDERCQLHGIKFAIGRDGSEPHSFETTIKLADRRRSYQNYDVFGRQIIDTQFLAEYVDVTNRDMPSYKLKDLIKYLGRDAPDRTYIDGEIISKVWDNKDHLFSREDLVKYAIEDVREAEILYNEFGQAFFTLTPMIPMNYQEVFRYGTGNEVEYVFMREYLEQGWSYPKHEETGSVPGGYTDVFNWGIFKDEIVYIDVKSLYPTLARELGVQPAKDELKLFPKILNRLTQKRYEIKDKIKEIEDEELKKRQKATDASVKIFLNTMAYGFIASPWNAFADYEQASRITLGGQEEAKKIIQKVNSDGGTVIRFDTDGGTIILPEKWKGNPNGYCQHLTDTGTKGIIVENDGVYAGIIPIDGKGYALLKKDGTIKEKGNTLIGRDMVGFGRKFISDCIEILFKNNFDEAKKKIRKEYKTLKQRIKERKLEPEELSIRKSLNMSLDSYIHKNETGNTQTIAQYELAKEANKNYEKGDVVYYYVKEYPYVATTHYGKPVLKKKDCKVYEAAELLENYDYDYEPEYYLEKLEKIARRFMALGEEKFYALFPDIKVYAKDKQKFEERHGREWIEI